MLLLYSRRAIPSASVLGHLKSIIKSESSFLKWDAERRGSTVVLVVLLVKLKIFYFTVSTKIGNSGWQPYQQLSNWMVDNSAKVKVLSLAWKCLENSAVQKPVERENKTHENGESC